MLTLFSIPKPFEGHIAVIQRNAIQSWLRLHPDCEVVLCGDDYGTQETARQFGVKYVPAIARNNYGTPLINSAFEQVERIAGHPLLCYVNADIIFAGNLVAAVQSIPSREFLMIGRRWDIDISEPLDFATTGWEHRLKNRVADHGFLHPPTGIDYFVFPRGIKWEAPPFAVGRPGWDNWLIYRARRLGLAVVDATRAVTAVHQNHNYTHVKYATDHTTEGPEADRNRELTGGWGHVFTISDATHFLQPGPVASFSLRRNLGTLPVSLLRPWKQMSFWCGAGCRVLRRRFSIGA
jgi:hypothetical protein